MSGMHHDRLQASLMELGAAREAGVFSAPAVAAFPWERSAPRRLVLRSTRWVRLALPLAAAAALGVVVWGPGFRHQQSGTPVVVVPATSAVVAVSPDEGDCNRDGAVNGLDIACFVSQKAESGDAVLQADALARRLLGV